MTSARPRLSLLALVATSLLPATARAAIAPYGVRLPPDGVVVDVPYTFGTHHEHVTEVHGVVRVDADALRLEQGRLAAPLAAFRSDDAERACHLRESLGLDYRRSRFPREHVCDGENHLPATGPDAIAYPEIVLELTGGSPGATAPGGARTVEVEGTLTAHGVSRPVRLDLTVSRDAPPDMLRVRGRLPLRLTDFGITVKAAKVVLVTISVRDEITVEIDALLEPLRRTAPG